MPRVEDHRQADIVLRPPRQTEHRPLPPNLRIAPSLAAPCARGREPHRPSRRDWPYCHGTSLLLACFVGVIVVLTGCKATVTEVRGRNAFGPEFRNRGNNTQEIRYDIRQGVELRWDNGVTTGLTYRYRPVDDGSGDQEHLALFEIGYPIWKAPKKPEKTAQQILDLELQVEELRSRLAAIDNGATSGPRVASASTED